LCEGLNGKITVNGRDYDNQMAPIALTDAEAADLLTFVRNSWGNSGAAATADEVKSVRATTKFPTYDALVKASRYAAWPPSPAGSTPRATVRLPAHPVKLAGAGQGKVLYVLCLSGNVWRVDVAAGSFRLLLKGDRYINKSLGNVSAMGLVLDPQ